MGCALIDQSALFRSILGECDNILHSLPDGPPWSIIQELSKPTCESSINEARFSQPLCTALQIGIVCLLGSWGIRPNAVVGHSSGEICAAFLAGSITMRHAIITAYYRGHVLAKSSTFSSPTEAQGSMCAIGLDEERCLDLLSGFNGQIQLAAINSPSSCTVSGNRTTIQNIVGLCTRKGHFCRQLKVDNGEHVICNWPTRSPWELIPFEAYHSHHMLPLALPYQRLLEKAEVFPSSDAQQCPLFSSVTGSVIEPGDVIPDYWAKNVTSTVRFQSAIEQCLHQNPKINSIIEVGPHPALKGPTQEILRNQGRHDAHYFSTCKRHEDSFRSILESVGEMIIAGMPIDTRAINAKEIFHDGILKHSYRKVLTDLPSYQWNHSSSFWFESRVSRNIRHREFPRHEFLGTRYVDDIPSRACWRNTVHPNEIHRLAELDVGNLGSLRLISVDLLV